MLGCKAQKTIYSFMVAGALTSLLSGCFQNISGTESASKKSTSQSNFTDSGGGTVNGAFNGTSILASTDIGGIVGSYSGALNSAQLGLMLNIKIPLINAIGEDVLNDLLNRVDAEAAVQNIDVTIRIPQFGIKAAFKFGKVAYGNSKQLRNVMSIRPAITGVDVTTGYLPEQAPAVQQANGYVFTYGGLVENSPIARLTITYRDSLTGAPGFLPTATNSVWGVGFPDNSDPQANAVFRPLTADLGKIFNRMYTDPATGNWTQSEDFKDTASNPTKYLLAIHRDASNNITNAYIINPLVGGPKGVLLCSAARNDTEELIADPANPTNFYYRGDKLACDCEPMEPEGAGAPRASQIYEYCGTPAQITAAMTTANKKPFLDTAISTRPATPSSGSFAISTVTSGGVTISPL